MPNLDAIHEFLGQAEALGNTPERWLTALAVAVGAAAALRVAMGLFIRHTEALAARRPSDWLDTVLDLLRHTRTWFLILLSLYCGSLLLVLPDKVARIASSVAVIAMLAQAALWGDALVKFSLTRQARRRAETDAGSATTLVALGFLARLTIWTIVVLLVLANLGIDVSAMVAGLGIGGIAVALAAQNVLGDLFASASIVLDKPFVLGDSITVGEDAGTVEYIGMKTTRLRSVSGEQLIFSNNDLLKSRIRNFKRMHERRAVFSLSVSYQIPGAKLAAIPAMLRETVETQSPVRFDRAHFKQYGDAGLVFEVVYYVLTPDYNCYMDIQQSINLAIFRRFAEEQIEFAYAARVVQPQK